MRILGSPRVEGDDDEDDVDDIDNEFNYAKGTSKARRQWQGQDPELSASSRHESQKPIPLLTHGQPVVILNNSFLLSFPYLHEIKATGYMKVFYVQLIDIWILK